MKSITIESSNQSTLKRIIEFVKYFWPGVFVEEGVRKESKVRKGNFQSGREFREVAGIWHSRGIGQEELRKKSWRKG